MQASKNPILRSRLACFQGLGWVELDRKAQVRLLRLAARYRATGDLLQVKDPYGGGDLLHSKAGDRMKFWSRDGNGVDDGGDAGSTERWTWYYRVPGAAAPRPPNDIVIEVDVPGPN